MTDHSNPGRYSRDHSRDHQVYDDDQAGEVEARARIVAGLRVALLSVETYRRLRALRPDACRDTIALAVITSRDPQHLSDAELAATVRAIYAEQEREADETAAQLAAQVAQAAAARATGSRATGSRVVQS